jgi:TonB family protein
MAPLRTSVIVVALFACAFARAAAAHLEICPGERGAIFPVAGSTALYAYDVMALSPRVLSGTVAFDTDAGWFTASFTPVSLVATPRYVGAHGPNEPFKAYSSGPLYVQFPQNVAIRNWWLLSAASTGDSTGWHAYGTVTCTPEVPPSFVSVANRVTLDAATQATFTQTPAPQATIARAAPIAPLAVGRCAVPFREASVRAAGLSNLNEAPTFMEPHWATMQIVIEPDGTVKNTAIDIPTGDEAYDAELLRWIRRSQFFPRVVYCHAVESTFRYEIELP